MRRSDPVVEVLAAMRRTRSAHLVRRFVHGSGGTSVVAVAGRRAVLKAWRRQAPAVANLEAAFGRMEVMRARGVPIPSALE